MKENINASERKSQIVLRFIQVILVCLLLVFGFIGVTPSKCTSKPGHFLQMFILTLILIAIFVVFSKLMASLKKYYFAMYLTHKVRLFFLCGGMTFSVLLLLVLYIVMQMSQDIALTGYELMLGHILGAFIPIIAYVTMIDATEDCFDCFNRSKD